MKPQHDRSSIATLSTCLAAATALLLGGRATAHAAGVPVGSSNLIDTLQYSDTFTLGVNGRTDGVYPVGGTPAALNVENTYGNPAQTWTNFKWSLNQDTSVFAATSTPYPGPSGFGSDTGITQTGVFGGWADFGIEYGLSSEYVVQYDAVQTLDRIDITSSFQRDSISDQASLSIFFRADDRQLTQYPNIGIYNAVAGETDTGLALSGTGAFVGQWTNYAVRFDLTNHEIEVYVNQVSLGVLDLATFAGGAYDNWSNAAVSAGGGGSSTIVWTDNFQVGTPASSPPVQAGDFDGDGDVDGADFVAWQTNFPTETGATLADGDADGDGDVDGADFVVWQTNFPFTPSPGVAPVPEPRAWLIAVSALVGLRFMRRSRQMH